MMKGLLKYVSLAGGRMYYTARGAEQFFTQYMLSQTANLNSVYSVRLYELLIQWKTAGKTPVFELALFLGSNGA